MVYKSIDGFAPEYEAIGDSFAAMDRDRGRLQLYCRVEYVHSIKATKWTVLRYNPS